MTEKQKLFADEYLIDLNATRAYMAVYTNVKKSTVAAANASRLLKNANVKAYIEKRIEEIHDERSADIYEIVEYLTSVIRGQEKDEVLKMVGEGVQEKTELRTSTKDRLKAAELLGKRFGMFTENVTLDVTLPVFKGDEELED